MAERITLLREATFSLCSAINAHLRHGGDAKVKRDLRALLAELRLLGGTLYSLEQFVSEPEDDQDGAAPVPSTPASATWPVVEGCELLLQALKTLHTLVNPQGLEDARLSLARYRSKFGFVLGSSETAQDVFTHFSVLGKEPTPKLPLRDARPSLVESPSDALASSEDPPSPEQLRAWLDMLNSPEHDREPEEYALEMAQVQARRITSPLYRTAALRWPTYAEAHWPELRPQISTLFQVPRSWNFVQWVLEYAREMYPRTYGHLAISSKVLLELTDALCNGSLSPLHMAAALGLPSLCEHLVALGANLNQMGFMGYPLFCALVGPNSLITRADPDQFTDILVAKHGNDDRANTILYLIEKGAYSQFSYNFKNAGEVSLAGVAFWAALITKRDEVFTRTVRRLLEIDNSFLILLGRPEVESLGTKCKGQFSCLLTYVYDLTLGNGIQGKISREEIRTAIHKIMEPLGLALEYSDEKALTVDTFDLGFQALVREAIVDTDGFLLRRLIMDPRFDPNLSYSTGEIGGTIMHLAVESGSLENIDSLILAGADLKATDAQGRTPMMLVEDPASLAKLVLEYGADTRDVDKEKRTIWHYAAATHFDTLLRWLIEHDPHKNENMAALTSTGYTPLAESLLHIAELRFRPKVSRPVIPTTARTLLREKHTETTMRSAASLTALAIEWGEMDLLESLLSLGYKDKDDESSLLLRHLNIGASDEMLDKVLELCGPCPLIFKNDASLAELILVNTVLVERPNPADFAQPTSHPSCYPKMTIASFEKLLTPEVLKHRDAKGLGIWERFCQHVLPKLSGPNCKHPPRVEFLTDIVCNVLKLLAKRGAMEDYESRTGRWAILHLADREAFAPSWERWQFPFVTAILEASNLEGSKFLQSMDAVLLLAQAVRRGQHPLAKILVDNGVRVDVPCRDFRGSCLLEHLITDVKLHGPLLDTLLSKLEPGALLDRQHEILGRIIELPRAFNPNLIMLELLAKNLIDPNKVTSKNPKTVSMLLDAIRHEKSDLAWMLLQQKADPAFSNSGDWPLLAAVEKGYVNLLEKMYEIKGPAFNWICQFDEAGKTTYNALQIAASHGRDLALSWLLQRTALRFHIDEGTPRNGFAPIHLAVRAGSLDCVKILDEYGADLEVRDPKGFTPLLLAVEANAEDIVRYLLNAGVDTEGDLYGVLILSSGRPHPSRIVNDFVTKKLQTVNYSGSAKPDPVKLGSVIAEMIEGYGARTESAFEHILSQIPMKELKAAILPCHGCTLLSYAGAHGCHRLMLELVKLGFGGFVTGCTGHWVHGYNALHHACFGLLRQLEPDQDELKEVTLLFLRECLDAYLEEGRLWFEVPCGPLHGVVQFGSGRRVPQWEIHERAVNILLNHLENNADKYWKLMEQAGLTVLCKYDKRDKSTKDTLLRYVVNRRCETLEYLDYTGGENTTALMLLIDAVARDFQDADNLDPIIKIAERLIECGADVNAQDNDLTTALHFATSRGILPLVKLLLSSGANPNLRDDLGTTPLARSFEWGNIDQVCLLMEHGAESSTFLGSPHIYLYTKYSGRYMHQISRAGFDTYAAKPGHSSISLLMTVTSPASRSLILNGDMDFDRLTSERPPLLYLLLNREISASAVKMVMRRIPKEYHDRVLHPVGNGSIPPVCVCIRNGQVKIIEMLMGYGWDYESHEASPDGTALMYACSMGSLKSVQLLVRRGAKLSYSAVGSRGEVIVKSALESARLYPEVVRWLLVGRFQEKTGIEDAKDVSCEANVKPWSGPRKGEYKISGFAGHYIRGSTHDSVFENTSAYYRMKGIRKELAGRVVQVKLFQHDD